MKNKLIDLNNHLFAQLERLGEEDLKPEQIQTEINRTKAMAGLGKTIVDNARLALEATKFKEKGSLIAQSNMPTMIEDKQS
jgi:hypothetical protein